MPSSHVEEVVRWQEETDEAATVLRLRGHVPLGGIFDVRPQTKRASIGGTLSPHELLDIASTMRAARQLRKFLEGTEAELPHMMAYAERIVPLVELEQHIYRCIDESGEVLDEASDRLRSLRHQLRTIEGRVRDKLESIIRSSSAQKHCLMRLLRFVTIGTSFQSSKNIAIRMVALYTISLHRARRYLLNRNQL